MKSTIILVAFVFFSNQLMVRCFMTANLASSEFGKSYIIRAIQDFTFEQAKVFCQNNGEQLVKIESREEWLWLTKNAPNMGPFWYWLGAAPVGSGRTPTHWLDGTKIERFFWRDETKTGSSDCNTLGISTHFGEPKMWAKACSTSNGYVICQSTVFHSTHLNGFKQDLVEKSATITQLQEQLSECSSNLTETVSNLIDKTTTLADLDLQFKQLSGELNSSRNELENCKIDTIELKYENSAQMNVSMTLGATIDRLSTTIDRQSSMLDRLSSTNHQQSLTNDRQSSTIDRQSSTIDQLIDKIAQLEETSKQQSDGLQ